MDSFGAKISLGRGVMMGAAILFIMFFHLQSGHFGWWSNFCNCYGLWGVDAAWFPYVAMGLSALLAALLHLMVAELRFPASSARKAE